MRILNEAFNKMFEELIEESAKTDFLNKFGQDTLNNFDKAKDRLRNKNMSVDYGQYLKMDKKELDNLILSLYDDKKDAQRKRIIQGTDKEIRGSYNYLGEKNGYKVYQPLDVQASMDLGVNTGWCTTGRYNHYGHPEYTPSKRDANKHWNDYAKKGVKFYYFLNPQTMYGEYAIALYPRTLNVDKEYGKYRIGKTNIEIFNAKDELDYSAINKLPIDLIPEKVVLKYEELEEVEIKDGVLKKYRGNAEKFVIPNEVFLIGDDAFLGCENLKEITIPNNVTHINYGAFAYCKGLKSLIIPNSVVDMEGGVFQFCTNLTNITIPSSIKKIGSYTFYRCENLTNVVIPNSVNEIGNCAFSDCKKLKNITIPNSVTSIGDFAFGYSGLTNIEIPNSVKKIDDFAFIRCSGLKNIIIPNSVTYIGLMVFDECKNLTVTTNSDYVKDYCIKNNIKIKE